MGNCVVRPKNARLSSHRYEMLRGMEQPIIWIYGGPGIGKRTQADMIVENFDFVLLHVYDVLQLEVAEPSARSFTVQSHLSKTVPDVPAEIVIEILQDHILTHIKRAKGFIICDFPRDERAGKLFEKEICKVSRILYLRGNTTTMRERSLNKIRSKQMISKLKDLGVFVVKNADSKVAKKVPAAKSKVKRKVSAAKSQSTKNKTTSASGTRNETKPLPVFMTYVITVQQNSPFKQGKPSLANTGNKTNVTKTSESQAKSENSEQKSKKPTQKIPLEKSDTSKSQRKSSVKTKTNQGLLSPEITRSNDRKSKIASTPNTSQRKSVSNSAKSDEDRASKNSKNSTAKPPQVKKVPVAAKKGEVKSGPIASKTTRHSSSKSIAQNGNKKGTSSMGRSSQNQYIKWSTEIQPGQVNNLIEKETNKPRAKSKVWQSNSDESIQWKDGDIPSKIISGVEQRIEDFFSHNDDILHHFRRRIAQIEAEQNAVAVFEDVSKIVNAVCIERGVDGYVK